jgi:translation initiation factor 4E
MSAPRETPKYLVDSIPAAEHHQLSEEWTFWYLIPDKKGKTTADWDSFLRKLCPVRSFEDFWAILNSIEPPAKLQKGCRYYIFKEGIRPVWEDPKNQGGRQAGCTYKTSQSSDPGSQEAQKRWEDLCQLVLGQSFEKGLEFINGIEFNCRNGNINVGLWMRPLDDAVLNDVKEQLKGRLNFPGDVTITKLEPKKP